jgi:hypothetical protein
MGGKEGTAVRVVRVADGGDRAVGEASIADASPFDEPREADLDPGFPIVLVTWHDAWFDFDQQDVDDCRADYLVRTVGFLVDDGPRFVSVAQEVLPDGDGFRAVTHIPRSIIEDLEELVPGTEPDLSALASGAAERYAPPVTDEEREGGMRR